MACDLSSPADVRRQLDAEGIFRDLEPFDPRWVGSVPLDIHGPGADADICCCAGPDLERFRLHLVTVFRRFGIQAEHNVHAGEASVIGRFSIGELPVEIYGRRRPVETHESFVHWLAEDRLLSLGGERLRADVRAAKRDGLKTEPAFAHALGLGGDPYVELLKLASAGDAALAALLRDAGYGETA